MSPRFRYPSGARFRWLPITVVRAELFGHKLTLKAKVPGWVIRACSWRNHAYNRVWDRTLPQNMRRGSRSWHAWGDWFHAHGVDLNTVMCSGVVSRYPGSRRIAYRGLYRDEHGRICNHPDTGLLDFLYVVQAGCEVQPFPRQNILDWLHRVMPGEHNPWRKQKSTNPLPPQELHEGYMGWSAPAVRAPGRSA